MYKIRKFIEKYNRARRRVEKLYKYMQTCDNDGDYNENTCRVSHRASSSEPPSYQSLYFDSLDPVVVEDNEDNGNMVLPNVEPLSDTSTSPRPPSNSYTRLRCKRIYSQES